MNTAYYVFGSTLKLNTRDEMLMCGQNGQSKKTDWWLKNSSRNVACFDTGQHLSNTSDHSAFRKMPRA